MIMITERYVEPFPEKTARGLLIEFEAEPYTETGLTIDLSGYFNTIEAARFEFSDSNETEHAILEAVLEKALRIRVFEIAEPQSEFVGDYTGRWYFRVVGI